MSNPLGIFNTLQPGHYVDVHEGALVAVRGEGWPGQSIEQVIDFLSRANLTEEQCREVNPGMIEGLRRASQRYDNLHTLFCKVLWPEEVVHTLLEGVTERDQEATLLLAYSRLASCDLSIRELKGLLNGLCGVDKIKLLVFWNDFFKQSLNENLSANDFVEMVRHGLAFIEGAKELRGKLFILYLIAVCRKDSEFSDTLQVAQTFTKNITDYEEKVCAFEAIMVVSHNQIDTRQPLMRSLYGKLKENRIYHFHLVSLMKEKLGENDRLLNELSKLDMGPYYNEVMQNRDNRPFLKVLLLEMQGSTPLREEIYSDPAPYLPHICRFPKLIPEFRKLLWNLSVHQLPLGHDPVVPYLSYRQVREYIGRMAIPAELPHYQMHYEEIQASPDPLRYILIMVQEKLPEKKLTELGACAKHRPEFFFPYVRDLADPQLAAIIPFLPDERLLEHMEKEAFPLPRIADIARRGSASLKSQLIQKATTQFHLQLASLLQLKHASTGTEEEWSVIMGLQRTLAIQMKDIERLFNVSIELEEDADFIDSLRLKKSQFLKMQGHLEHIALVCPRFEAISQEYLDPVTLSILSDPLKIPQTGGHIDASTLPFLLKEDGRVTHPILQEITHLPEEYLPDPDFKKQLESWKASKTACFFDIN